MLSDEVVARTLRLDCARQMCAGVLESAAQTFLLLIAVRTFDAGALDKAAIAAGSSIGLLLSPFAVQLARATRATAAATVARLLAVGALASLTMALHPVLWLYVPASVIALSTTSAAIPLMVQIYQENYPTGRRGQLYARTQMLRIATAMAFAAAGGLFLTWHPRAFPVLLLTFAAAYAGAALAVRAMPSEPLARGAGSHPLAGFTYVRSDALFRQTLVVWMLMGFANLMMAPLRVEYLANPRHGLHLDATDIALLTAVLPNAARLVTSPMWGMLFDRMNFFAMRAMLNVGLTLGLIAFFTADRWSGWLLGAVLTGVSVAGADVAWSLWVTKLAPPERVADYMSVHTFLTGLRGVVAPVAGFLLIERYTPATLGIFCAALILAATALLVPGMRRRRVS